MAATVTDFNLKEAAKTGKTPEIYTEDHARRDIKRYFDTYKELKNWLDACKESIQENGYIYSILGRKRRLKNVWSADKGIATSEIRSGINFLIQSLSSDVNLLAAMDMNDYIKEEGLDAKIFALVHDSIIAEVAETDLEEYLLKLGEFTQVDRGFSIPGAPIGIDQEIGTDYSFGKLEKEEFYPDIAAL